MRQMISTDRHGSLWAMQVACGNVLGCKLAIRMTDMRWSLTVATESSIEVGDSICLLTP